MHSSERKRMTEDTGDEILVAGGVEKEVPTAAGPLTILSGSELTIKQGETVALVGESGSGKTTLLGLRAGLDEPSSGRIELGGHAV